MRLVITTPTAIIADVKDVSHVRAEDETGSFGILEGHTDFLTVLSVSVLRWRAKSSGTHYCAVRHGVLSVSGGHEVSVATREAVLGIDIEQLESAILAQFRLTAEEEHVARSQAAQLELTAIRRIIRYLRPSREILLRNGP